MSLRTLLVGSIAMFSAATADDGDRVSGVLVPDGGELRGTIRDARGPVPQAEIHVVEPGGTHRRLATDRDGGFRVRVARSSMVYVHGTRQIDSHVVVDGLDEAVIQIRDMIPPAQLPKPITSPLVVPPYSAAAIEHNTWVRTWVMVDVDPRGAVSRLKLLGKPGHGLEPIAIAAAAKLRFEPARNAAGHAVPALTLWALEWPAYYWMLDRKLPVTRMPPGDIYLRLPCRNTGPSETVYRDCARPDLKLAVGPWIDAAKITNAR